MSDGAREPLRYQEENALTRTEARAAPTTILFVCTANQCRSPFAQAIAYRYADPQKFLLESAGIRMGHGESIPRSGLRVASEIGLNISEHRSRRAATSELRVWDVILAMTREHVRELVAADPTLWPRAFTIKQFRRWLEEHPPAPGADLREWIDRAAADRSRFEAVGASHDDDIADPLRLPAAAWRRMAAVMDEELAAIFRSLDATTLGGGELETHPVPDSGAESEPIKLARSLSARSRGGRHRSLQGES